jgi:amidase
MAITRPSIEDLIDTAASMGMSLTLDEAQQYLALMQGNFDAYDLIDVMPDYIPAVKYPRTPGYRPSAAENPLNAWYWKSEVRARRTAS